MGPKRPLPSQSGPSPPKHWGLPKSGLRSRGPLDLIFKIRGRRSSMFGAETAPSLPKRTFPSPKPTGKGGGRSPPTFSRGRFDPSNRRLPRPFYEPGVDLGPDRSQQFCPAICHRPLDLILKIRAGYRRFFGPKRPLPSQSGSSPPKHPEGKLGPKPPTFSMGYREHTA